MNPNKSHEDQKNVLVPEEEIQELRQCLPKAFFMGKMELLKYQSFWYGSDTNMLKNTLLFQRHFRARDSDLIISSFPKTGTTWLKSLLYCVINRFNYPSIKQSPLLKHHPQELICRLEHDIYGDAFENLHPNHLSELPSPRLFGTHLPYSALAESIKLSGCRVLYITRNPLDTMVSMMHFIMKPLRKLSGDEDYQPSFEGYFEEFYQGKTVHGPFLDHVVEYWKQSLERPDKVLFLKYEDLKENPILELKKMAEFVGMPFSTGEESEGVINEIVEQCNINNLKELEVNKSGFINEIYDKDSYFRKGEVGDWTNHLTPLMVERMKKLMEEKLEGTSLSFQLLPS